MRNGGKLIKERQLQEPVMWMWMLLIMRDGQLFTILYVPWMWGHLITKKFSLSWQIVKQIFKRRTMQAYLPWTMLWFEGHVSWQLFSRNSPVWRRIKWWMFFFFRFISFNWAFEPLPFGQWTYQILDKIHNFEGIGTRLIAVAISMREIVR